MIASCLVEGSLGRAIAVPIFLDASQRPLGANRVPLTPPVAQDFE